jgi:uncharacterized protein YkwD
MAVLRVAVLTGVVGCILAACGGHLPMPASAEPSVEQSPTLRSSEIELLIHRLVNSRRTQSRLPELALDADLANVARRHSRDMAIRDYFNHVDPTHGSPSDRAAHAGYTCDRVIAGVRYTGISENIALQHTYRRYREVVRGGVRERTYEWNSAADIAEAVVNGWMSSTGHRANLLDRRVDRQGIGVHIEGDRVLVTQNLC